MGYRKSQWWDTDIVCHDITNLKQGKVESISASISPPPPPQTTKNISKKVKKR